MKENTSSLEEQMDWVNDGVQTVPDHINTVQQENRSDVRTQVEEILRLRRVARLTSSSFDVANYRFAYRDADDDVKAEVDRTE